MSDTKLMTVHIKLEPKLLKMLDALAKKQGFVTRASYIRFILTSLLADKS